MDLKQLLEKLDQFAGQAVGQKPGDQVRGTEIAKPTKSGKDHPFKGRLVGGGAQESVLKDLSKGPTPKTKEQELSEEFQAFLEAEFKDTIDKRPGRKSDRPSRGHQPQSRYKTIKTEMDKSQTPPGRDDPYDYDKGDWHEGKPLKAKDVAGELSKSFSPSEYKWEITFKDGKRAVYHQSSPHYRDATAADDIKYIVKSNPGSTVKAYKDGEPFDWQALLSEGAADRVYTVDITRSRGMSPSTTRSTSGTLAELIDYFGYTLEVGKSYESERGRYKINMAPKNIQSLVDNLNKAQSNAAANGMPNTYYDISGEQLEESGDQVKKVIKDKQGNAIGEIGIDPEASPGTGNWYVKHYASGYDVVGFDDAEEAAEELFAAEEAHYNETHHSEPTTDTFGNPISPSNIHGMNEGWESGPEEPRERPEPDPDDWYDRKRQDQLDIEAEKENAKRPQEKVYTLVGRGPNMEPNYKFPGEYKSQEAAMAAREKIMADPDTPHPEHIGIHSYTRYLDEAESKAKLIEKAKELGIDESRAHKTLDTWFKNRERQEKFAKGELKIPTPQERRAELNKQKEKEQVKEYGANTSTASMGSAPSGAQQQQGVIPDVSKLTPQQKQQLALQLDPQAMKKAAAATSQIKSATGSQASGPNLLKALNAASQGKSVSGQDMTALKPMMDVVKKAATDPKLATQFKSLASQAKQIK